MKRLAVGLLALVILIGCAASICLPIREQGRAL